MPITIKDVARESGYSVATVSLVLNDKESRISKSARAKILQTAEAMNYRPNRLAVGLVTQKTHTIGLIVPDISNIHFAEMCKAIEQECRNNGYIVLLGSYGSSDDQAYEYFKEFIDKRAEGIILAKPLMTELSEKEKMCFSLAEKAKVPVVTFEPIAAAKGVRTVGFDFETGGYLATKHLIDLGHRRIGCVTGPQKMLSSLGRLSGYKKALAEAGIEFDLDLIYEGDFTLGSGIQALPYLLGQNVTAVFAFNDMMAMGVYKAARSYQLRIPSDLSLVGFDDIDLNEILEVPLTSVTHPANAMGKESAKQILSMIEGEEREHGILFRPSLKVRGSARRL
ncbi:LacI family DNA-binding transcriptional regulator [Gorillibacterium massiliense]|uniref:LacI family DNA-binding transcriptional regulator n=1 Tax=Gorillibacterium massiliense TaxID=1280390 RepID=UPI0004BB7CEE|nr:LacI family DNA-binding transcriptional regulator [Gorillibacterium massiliense]